MNGSSVPIQLGQTADLTFVHKYGQVLCDISPRFHKEQLQSSVWVQLLPGAPLKYQIIILYQALNMLIDRD